MQAIAVSWELEQQGWGKWETPRPPTTLATLIRAKIKREQHQRIQQLD